VPVGAAEPAAPATPPKGDRARADQLFREGRELIAAGKTKEACEKFELSQAADSSPGTLLNLAACRLREGDLVRAREGFRHAAALAVEHPDAARRKAWVDAASGELLKLEPRIPNLEWTVRAADSVTLKVDGKPIERPAANARTPVNPGAHRIDAEAPGRVPWSLEVSVREGEVAAVVVPELAAVLAPLPPEPPAQAAPAPKASQPPERGIAPYVLFGASGLLLGGGVATGLMANSAEGDLEEQCTEPDPMHPGKLLCDPSLESTRDRARTLGIVTDVLWAGAVVSAGLGVYLYLRKPEPDRAGQTSPRATARIGVQSSARGASLDIRGDF